MVALGARAEGRFLALTAEDPLFGERLVEPESTGSRRLDAIAKQITAQQPHARSEKAGAALRFELGSYHHTFTATARCPRTGRFGIAVAT